MVARREVWDSASDGGCQHSVDASKTDEIPPFSALQSENSDDKEDAEEIDEDAGGEDDDEDAAAAGSGSDDDDEDEGDEDDEGSASEEAEEAAEAEEALEREEEAEAPVAEDTSRITTSAAASGPTSTKELPVDVDDILAELTFAQRQELDTVAAKYVLYATNPSEEETPQQKKT